MFSPESNHPLLPISASAGVIPPLADMTHAHIHRSGVVVLPLVALLLVALSSCSSTGTVVSPAIASPTKAPSIQFTPLPAGPSVYEVAQTTTLSGTSNGPATVSCPQGEVALGGGWQVPTQGVGVYSAMLSGNTWTVYAQHSLPRKITAPPPTITAYVECLHGAPQAIVTPRAFTSSVAPDAYNTLPMSCNNGEVPVGFGFDFSASYTSLELIGTYGFSNNQVLPGIYWFLNTQNTGSTSHTIFAYVDCLSNVAVSATYLAAVGNQVSAGMTASAVVSCPLVAVVAGVGAAFGNTAGSPAAASIYELHAVLTESQAAMYVSSGTTKASAYAACLQFA